MSRIVAIVGRPNVGKSRLFNRLARKRISIVHDQPGVTRDVISTEVKEGGYTLLDTGGIGLQGGETPKQLITASEQQVDFAIASASLILFIIDGREPVTSLDERIAASLRRGGKTVRVVINKVDETDEKIDLAPIFRFGLGEPILVSAEHGRGESNLRSAIVEALGPEPEEGPAKTAADPLCICFIGRPNVGKSSLGNRFLASERLIVSPIPGTTRDAVELAFEFKGRDGKMYPFRLIDTAGIKASTKLSSPVEYFSRLRSIDSIQRADVVFMVVDALEGVTQQDKAIAGEAIKERKPIVVVVNKWDLVHKAFAHGQTVQGYESERDYREKYTRAVFDRLFFTPGSPLIFVSALSGYEVDRMLNAAVKLHRSLDKQLPTGRLNQTLSRLVERTPPPAVHNKRFRVYYAVQTGTRPYRLRLFCNREEQLTESYRRYLEAGIVEEFSLQGCPVYFELIGKPKGGMRAADWQSRKEARSRSKRDSDDEDLPPPEE